MTLGDAFKNMNKHGPLQRHVAWSVSTAMEGPFLEVPGGYSIPGTSYSVPSTNYEVPPTQGVVPVTNYEGSTVPGVNMGAYGPMAYGPGGAYSTPTTRYDVPGNPGAEHPAMMYAAPQTSELTPASTFATTFTTTTNEVPSMTYAAPTMDHNLPNPYTTPISSFQPPTSPEPISTGAFLAGHPELGLDATARAFASPEPVVGCGTTTPLATTPARCSETPTTLVGATPLVGTAPGTPRVVSFAPHSGTPPTRSLSHQSPGPSPMLGSVRQVPMPSKVVKEHISIHAWLVSAFRIFLV